MSNGIRKSLAAAATLGITAMSLAQPPSGAGRVTSAPPPWAADATWYQVYVSRFANGDPTNDLPGTVPWELDWLKYPAGDPPSRSDLFVRRYGGDLQGLQAKLPYLAELGVNTLYLNPIFAADTEHKYDTTDLRHIDDSFGVAGAMQRLNMETTEPHTWKWSDSDRVFLDFLADAHGRGFRVILDGVFNHVGRRFWAFEDVLARGRNSAYADWFDITDFGPPLQWNAWDGPNGHLVRFARKVNALPPAVEQHIFDITRRWMDPNGDGDPSDGIDGWRLDAPQDLPHQFWRKWRNHVKAINPQAIIVGEIWTDPTDWMGDQFDCVTNYRLADAIIEWLRPALHPPSTTGFARRIDRLLRQFRPEQTLAMVNILDSHDTDRAVSMLANPGRGYDRDNLPGAGNPPYHNGPPSDDAYARYMLAATLQFTLPGAPMIYYGDEVGMYGGEDPYSRSPMWWPGSNGWDQIGVREDVSRHLKSLIRLRSENAALRHGSYHVVLAEDRRRLLAFERMAGDQRLLIFANAGSEQAMLQFNFPPPSDPVSTDSTEALPEVEVSGTQPATNPRVVKLTCGPLEAVVLLSRSGRQAKEILKLQFKR